MIVDNIRWLNQRDRKLKEFLQEGNFENHEIVETKSGLNTILIEKEGKKQSLHSLYNPLREAESLVNKYRAAIQKGTPIIFLGAGFGYHIPLFVEHFAPEQFWIVELDSFVLDQFLTQNELGKKEFKRLQNIYLLPFHPDIQGLLYRDTVVLDQQPIIVPLPSYERLFSKEIKQFYENRKKSLEGTKERLVNDYTFPKKWVYNTVKNAKIVAETPNIMMDIDKKQFLGKPAILVSAGPSLNEEIENLRKIKEEESAYIFSVGSAINTLIEYGIYPHAAFTYDPFEVNNRVFKKIKDEQIKTIPLVFGSSVRYDVIENYPGNLLHFITSPDRISINMLKHSSLNNLTIIADAPSIAILTLQILYSLGCDPIVLVGQNFAFRSNARYSSGINYENVENELSDKEIESAIEIESVTGEMILSNNSFVSMKKSMEILLPHFKNRSVINTTVDGAKIAHTKFQRLETLMGQFTPHSISKEWNKDTVANYDEAFRRQKWEFLMKDKEQLPQLFKQIEKVLIELAKAVEYKKMNSINPLFSRLDEIVAKVTANSFYHVVLDPMVAFEWALLRKDMTRVRFETDLLYKGNIVLKHYGNVLEKWHECYAIIEPAFNSIFS